MSRLFVAVDLSPEVNQAIAEAVQKMRKHSWLNRIPPENYHITIKFLGATEENALGAITDTLQAVAQEFKAFEIAARNVGAFPIETRARVVWIGLVPLSENNEVKILAKRLEEAFVPLGFKKEEREFVPHLTIAKLRLPRNVSPLLDPLRAKEFGTSLIQGLTLYESVQTGGGPPEYRVVKYFAF